MSLSGTPNHSQTASPLRTTASNTSATNLNQCQKCHRNVAKSKPSLKCCCCHLSTHTSCTTDWTDVTSNIELTKIISRPGLTWYCPGCQSKLSDYIYIPEIQPSLEQLDQKIDKLTQLVAENQKTTDKIDKLHQLVSENHKITKTYAQITGESREDNTELKAIAKRLDERTSREIQTRENLERKQSVIIHYLPENVNTHSKVQEILQDLNFHPGSTTRVSRLGTFKQDMSKPRPTKIQFHTEIMKIDFLRLFNSSSDKKNGIFATPDLSKEEQNREFLLRQSRNELTIKFKENKYRIRSGKLQCKTNSSDWFNIDSNKLQSHPPNNSTTIITDPNITIAVPEFHDDSTVTETKNGS